MLRPLDAYNPRVRGATPATLRTGCDCPAGHECYALAEGETLLGVARRYGISLRRLLELNPDLNPYYYRAGDTICVPSQQNACVGGRMYIAVRGDTLYNIGERFGVSVDDMAAANPGVDPMKINIGQVICIPVPEAVQPPVEEAPVEMTPPSGIVETPVEQITPVPAAPIDITIPIEIVMPVTPEAPAAPVVPVVPETPVTPVAPVVPVMPETPQTIVTPVVPQEPAAQEGIECPGTLPLIPLPVIPSMQSLSNAVTLVHTASPDMRRSNNLYILSHDESITDILLRMNISYGALQLANPEMNLLDTKAGDAIAVPDESTTGGCIDASGAYVIMTGDTLPTLARSFRVSVLEILVNNPLMAPGDFVTGRVICMPTGNT